MAESVQAMNDAACCSFGYRQEMIDQVVNLMVFRVAPRDDISPCANEDKLRYAHCYSLKNCVVLNVMPIWEHVYDVPPLMLSEEVSWELGRLLGNLLRVDADKEGKIFSEFVRVRVEHNVNTGSRGQV